MKKIIALVLVASCCLTVLCSCNSQKLNFGKEYVPIDTQLDVLIQLNSKSIDVGVIDSVMAGYYLNADSAYANNLTIATCVELLSEQYGIAARKGSALIYYINKALVELANDGTLGTLAEQFGLKDYLCIDNDYVGNEPTDTSDWDYIKNSGKLIIGYTLFAPIAYEKDGKLTGFDIELAKLVCQKLEIEVEFVVILWEQKEINLESKSIDCIWNGLTITDERKAAMEISIPYLTNKQVAVIRKDDADKFKTTADMKNALIGAESGSAGESCIIIERK